MHISYMYGFVAFLVPGAGFTKVLLLVWSLPSHSVFLAYTSLKNAREDPGPFQVIFLFLIPVHTDEDWQMYKSNEGDEDGDCQEAN